MTKPPYSPVRRAGDLLYVSGQLGWTEDHVFADGVESQTHLALQNLERCLLEEGLDRRHVVKTTVFLVDMRLWESMNEAYVAFFDDPLPARSTVGVSLVPGAHVEVEAVACASMAGSAQRRSPTE